MVFSLVIVRTDISFLFRSLRHIVNVARLLPIFIFNGLYTNKIILNIKQAICW